MNKTYREMSKLKTLKERFEYLKLGGSVGEETFGWTRYINQMLYASPRWKKTRDQIILRDNGCDLGLEGYDIIGKILIHHINPITLDDIVQQRECVFDPENLISTSLMTHNAIHYGSEQLLPQEPVIRTKNDTCPWRH